MSNEFTITAASNSIPLSAKRQGSAAYTVFNASGRPMTGRAVLETVPEGESHAAWLTVAGESERSFVIGAAEQFKVNVNVPDAAAAGSYNFRLNMVDVANTDEGVTDGPTVTVVVPGPVQNGGKFPLWIIPIIVGVLAVIAVVIYLLTRSQTVTMPNVVGLSESDAEGTLVASDLAIGRVRDEASDAVAAGLVARTDPEAGTEVEEAAQVGIYLSSGPNATVTRAPTEIPTQIPTITPTPVPPEQTWKYDPSVSDNRVIYYLRLTEPGLISVNATWTGAQSDLAFIINGPGQVGYYARQDGSSSEQVSYNVTASDLAAGDTWRVTIGSFGTDRAEGDVTISYPGGSTSGGFRDSFVVQPGIGQQVSALVLRNPGAIDATATWTGSPTNLALIINGPGQVGYYARQDGSSPLSVRYDVTEADLRDGDNWRVTLISFSTPSIGNATMSLTYR